MNRLIGRHSIEFYEDTLGGSPVLDWIVKELSPNQRRALGSAMRRILQEQGVNVCGTAFGRQLKWGLFEFRVRGPALLLRVFCHTYGGGVVLLLGGYDKRADPSKKRQRREIELARRRLAEWQARRRVA